MKYLKVFVVKGLEKLGVVLDAIDNRDGSMVQKLSSIVFDKELECRRAWAVWV